MISFRKKIIISDLILFVLFLSVIFFIAGEVVQIVIKKDHIDRANFLVTSLSQSSSVDEAINILNYKKKSIFFRVSLLDKNKVRLFDSHIDSFFQETKAFHIVEEDPDIEIAFKKGVGYVVSYSKIFDQTFAYVAKSFKLNKQTFILRIAYPYNQVVEVMKDFRIAFVTLGAMILLLYAIMTNGIVHRLSRPIQQIITAIKPFQEGQVKFLPKIELDDWISQNDDFYYLAQTLNELSKKIKTQIKTLTYQKNENLAILESLVEGILSLDEKGEFLFVNSVAIKMLGINLKDFNKIENNLLLEKCRDLEKKAKKDQKSVQKLFIFGDIDKIFINIIAIPKKQKNGVILVLQDKTSDYKIVQMGKDFVANASHELKTPLTIISGFAETLQDHPEMPKEKIADVSKKITKTCHRLTLLIQNLLTLAEVDNISKHKFVDCNLDAILENSKHILFSHYKNFDINIRSSNPNLFIKGNSSLLELAILNLLENSIKYSVNKPKIDISIFNESDKVRIVVEDEGVGIPSKDIDHIFDRFYTVDKARSKKLGGSGLGLSIVRNIIEKHKGKIMAAHKEKGVSFSITLPI